MNRRRFGLIAAAALMLAPAAMAWTPISDALADSRRPAADLERDARSKPADIVAFAGVKPGDHVADLVVGGGYYTRVFSGVVGSSGKVFAWQPAEFAGFAKPVAEWAGAWTNVTTNGAGFADLSLPADLDVVFTNQNYHDFHIKEVPAGSAERMNAAIFRALKPGGVYIVIDHSAAPGSPADATANALHRIDPEVVKREVTAAGFVLDGSSDVLRNPGDDLAIQVFKPEVRGKTDQFILRFRKPR